MSANIDSMMAVGQTPWHGLGKVLPEGTRLSVEEAMTAAQLDWVVDTLPLFTEAGKRVPAYATFRSDNNATLGVVGERYRPLQNVEAFRFFQPFLDANEATFETAGALGNGEKVWVLAKLTNNPDMVIKKDDIVSKYILLSNSHDGTTAIRTGFTPIRVVCQNTLSIAHNNSQSKLLKVKHTHSASATLQTIRETMNAIDSSFEATAEQYRYLADKQVGKKELEQYVKVVFNKAEEDESKRLLEKVVPLFEAGKGADIAGTTWWGAYNAITEFTSWHRGRSQDTRMQSLWFGQSKETNDRALETAMKMAA